MTIKELLILHHTHTDIGYTHPQPIVWELHNRHLNEAIALCEQTADWPEPARMKWTCEVTGTFLHWLDSASENQTRRLEALVRQEQISFGAMWCHWMLPLPRDLFAESLRPVEVIRKRFGAPVSVAIQHDVNGIPWSAVEVLNDAGIPHLLMGINIHMGAFPLPRPMVFRWAGPTGRTLLVFSGEHYNTFSRVANLRESSLDRMEAGLRKYWARLEKKDWPHDFAFLTATHPFMDDNGPPNPLLPGLIRRWNEEGREPFIRLITPERLFARIRMLPESTVPIQRGDWTDYWSNGCGSMALETLISRRAHSAWSSARALASVSARCLNPEMESRVTRYLFLAHEHTAGAFNSTAAFGPSRWMEPVPVAQQWNQKAAYCASALSYAQMLRRDALEAALSIPSQTGCCTRLLAFNPSELPRCVCLRLPAELLERKYPRLAAVNHRLDVVEDLLYSGDAEWIGPLELPPLGLVQYALNELPPGVVASGVLAHRGRIESPHFTLSFDPATGRVLSMRPRASGAECVEATSLWELFGPVRETVAQCSDESRAAADPRLDFFAVTEQDFDRVHEDADCWHRSWLAQYERPHSIIRLETNVDAEGAHLVRAFQMAGVDGELRQTITLLAHEPRVRFEAYFNKANNLDPESLYFIFPFRIPLAQMYFDSGGVPVAFDRDQLPGACRDWVAAGNWVAVSGTEGCLTLACPDAPMFQVGGFHYGRGIKTASDLNQALLLAWPLNNYWNTNFRVSQPGFIRLRYELTWSPSFDAAACLRFGVSCARPVV